MSVELFSKAKLAADAGDYGLALSYYRLAGNIYGHNAVAYNIKFCQSKLRGLATKLGPDIHVLFSKAHSSLDNLGPCLNSLINQTLPPREIVIYLLKSNEGGQGVQPESASLKPLKEIPNVRLVWCKQPSNFVIVENFLHQHYNCDEFEDKLFVCVDSGQVYPVNMLEALFSEYVISESIVAFNNVRLTSTHKDVPFECIPAFDSGVLFSTNFFNGDVCTLDDITDENSLTTELWLLWQALLNGVNVSYIPFEEAHDQIKTHHFDLPVRLFEQLENLTEQRYGLNLSQLINLSKNLSF